MNAFNFTQASPSDTWVIVHNLNNPYPNVDVFVNYMSSLVKVMPLDIVADSVNQVTVTFTSAQSGAARVTA